MLLDVDSTFSIRQKRQHLYSINSMHASNTRFRSLYNPLSFFLKITSELFHVTASMYYDNNTHHVATRFDTFFIIEAIKKQDAYIRLSH